MEQNVKSILAARARIADRIKIYAKKHYDARPMLPEFHRLTQVLRGMGRSVRIENKVFTDKYWENPATYSNQYLNKNPIIDAKDGDLIWAHERNHGSVKKDMIDLKKEDHMQPRRTTIEHNPKKPIKPYYYKVNISWIEREGTPKELINRLIHFLELSGLEMVRVHDFDNGHEIEKTAELKIQGSADTFNQVKRSAMAFLEEVVGGIPQFNIAISGTQYEDFEI